MHNIFLFTLYKLFTAANIFVTYSYFSRVIRSMSFPFAIHLISNVSPGRRVASMQLLFPLLEHIVLSFASHSGPATILVKGGNVDAVLSNPKQIKRVLYNCSNSNMCLFNK